MMTENGSKLTYMDIFIGGESIGRIVFELFTQEAPKTCANFIQLSTSETGYKSTYFHRIIKGFMIQGGDTDFGRIHENGRAYLSQNVGKGGKSIYEGGLPFEDENLVEIDKSFQLCMANSGPSTNQSQFFITTEPAPHLNGKHSVFGKVIKGKSTVRTIEKVNVSKTTNCPDFDSRVLITDCGVWEEPMGVPVYNCSYDTIGRDFYEEYPDDNEGLDLENAEANYRIVSLIKESGTLLFKQKKLKDAYFKWVKAARYATELIPDEGSDKKYYNYFVEIKRKIYLNLSLVSLQSQEYKQVIKYCNYILADGDGKGFKAMTAAEQSKVIYRLAMAYGGLKDYESALSHLILIRDESTAKTDPAVIAAIEKFTKLQKEAKASQQQKFANFFN